MDWVKGRDLRAAGCALLCALFGVAWQADAALATYGKVTVVKQNAGGNPADSFAFSANLYPAKPGFSLLGGEKKTYEIDCNVGTNCRPGALQITEAQTPGYTMTGAVCRTRTGTQNAFSTEPTDADPVDTDTTIAGTTINYKVKFREWVKCTITNTRDRGSIKVVKDVAGVPGYADAGRFDLLVDGQVKADEIADGGATPAVDVTTGTHTVGEAAGAGTTLADYDRRVDCSAPGKAPVVSVAGSELSLAVGQGEAWTCVITNTRKRGDADRGQGPAPGHGRGSLRPHDRRAGQGHRRRKRRDDRRRGRAHGHAHRGRAGGRRGRPRRLPELDRLRQRRRRRHRSARRHRGPRRRRRVHDRQRAPRRPHPRGEDRPGHRLLGRSAAVRLRRDEPGQRDPDRGHGERRPMRRRRRPDLEGGRRPGRRTGARRALALHVLVRRDARERRPQPGRQHGDGDGQGQHGPDREGHGPPRDALPAPGDRHRQGRAGHRDRGRPA